MTARYDEITPCPKCGHVLVENRYVKLWGGLLERIRRTCQRCGYIWDQLPLDTARRA